MDKPQPLTFLDMYLPHHEGTHKMAIHIHHMKTRYNTNMLGRKYVV